jgi:hypothetical protein
VRVIRERFPDADVLAQRGHWDDATRNVVMDRIHNVPEYRHFHGHERATLEALCDRVMPQPTRSPAHRIPVAAWIDERCASGEATGFRFADMPPHTEAWSLGLAGIDEAARALHGADFASLDGPRQDDVLNRVRGGDPPGATWERLPARRWWVAMALREIVGIYYAHPAAWDEIGYGGPAYPRGYAALNHGARERWEASEDREARAADERERHERELRPALELPGPEARDTGPLVITQAREATRREAAGPLAARPLAAGQATSGSASPAPAAGVSAAGVPDRREGRTP